MQTKETPTLMWLQGGIPFSSVAGMARPVNGVVLGVSVAARSISPHERQKGGTSPQTQTLGQHWSLFPIGESLGDKKSSDPVAVPHPILSLPPSLALSLIYILSYLSCAIWASNMSRWRGFGSF